MPDSSYHLAELAIALDPTRPEHNLPDLTSARVGVVDVGCGVGQLFVATDQESPVGVPRYGFDVDPAAIAYANSHWPDKATFMVAPAERLPLTDGVVDLYVSRVSLPYADIRLALTEAARVLVPDGRLWITLHPLSMTLQELRDSIRAGRLKETVRRFIVLLNGIAFHVSGTGHRLLGIRDSWQSAGRMRRELEPHFRDIRVSTRQGLFLIEATRR
jgi:SAM-dependent methyltransferase